MISVETEQMMQEEVSQVQQTCTKVPKSPHVQSLHHPDHEGCPALLTVSHLDPALHTSPVQLTKGTNKIHPVWPVLHPAHTVSTALSPAQTFHSLEQRKRQSACPNTKTPAPKQIRSSTSQSQGALGEGKVFATSFQPLQHPQTYCRASTDYTAGG